jgi:hypothetical protein
MRTRYASKPLFLNLNLGLYDAFCPCAGVTVGYEDASWVWIGLTDRDVEGTWVLPSTNENAPYTRWNPDEPGGGNIYWQEDCAFLTHDGAGRWGDHNCDTRMTYVCQYL